MNCIYSEFIFHLKVSEISFLSLIFSSDIQCKAIDIVVVNQHSLQYMKLQQGLTLSYCLKGLRRQTLCLKLLQIVFLKNNTHNNFTLYCRTS